MSHNLGALYQEQEKQASRDKEQEAQAQSDDSKLRIQEELEECVKSKEWINKECDKVIASIRTDIDKKGVQPRYDIHYSMFDLCDRVYVAATKEKLIENGFSGFKVSSVGISNIEEINAVRIEPDTDENK